MVEVSVRYEGGLRCSARHGPSSVMFKTDAPVDNHGRGESFSPTDLLATALGTCMLTVIGITAQRKGLSVEGAEVRVRKFMSQDTPRRVVRLESEIDLPLPSHHPDCGLLQAAVFGCPVHHSLHPEIEKPVVFNWSE